jgi:hypothetical protein
VTLAHALAAALAVEHEVIYGYGVAGAHLAGRERAAARAAYDAHRLRRDRLADLLAGRGLTPPVAAAAYAMPFPVTDAASARRLCVRLEDGCAGAAWDLVSASPAADTTRLLGVQWLAEAATGAAMWRGSAGSPLPGQPA